MKQKSISSIGISILGLCAITVLAASPPQWWDDRDVVSSNPAQDNAVASQGQLRHIATKAAEEFDDKLSEFDLSAVDAVDSYLRNLALNSNNYVAINLGQLKYVAAPFYDLLDALLLTNAWPEGMTIGPYPWSGNQPEDYALANIGQLKYLFSFNPYVDIDNDGLPDIWELTWFSGSTNALPEGDPDSDKVNNLLEFQRGINPTNAHEVTAEAMTWSPPAESIGAFDLVAVSNILYVSGGSRLSLFDISNPTNPEFLAATNGPALPNFRIAEKDGYVYGFRKRNKGLQQFDCTDPSKPENIGQASIPTGAVSTIQGDVIVDDEYLYVWDANDIEVFSLTNPASPQWISSVTNISAPAYDLRIKDVYIDNDLLYAGYGNTNIHSENNGFAVWDISNPSTPSMETWVETSNSVNSFMRQSNTLFVSEIDRSLGTVQVRSLDVTGGFPTNYIPLSETQPYPGHALFSEMEINDQWLYINLPETQQLLIVDISMSSNLNAYEFSLEGIAPQWSMRAPERHGTTLYIGLNAYGICVLDVSDPGKPIIVNVIYPNSAEKKLITYGDTLYVQQSQGSVTALDGTGLAVTDEFYIPNGLDLYFANDLAYSVGARGLSVYSMTSSPPARVSEIMMDFEFDSVVVQGDYAYCGSWAGEVLVTVDCSDLQNMVAVHTNDSLGFIDRLTLNGDYLYASSLNKGLLIFDIMATPSQPEKVGQFDTRSCFRDVSIVSNLVYAADGINGVLVLDVTNPTNTVQVGQLELEYAQQLSLSGDRICVAGYQSVYFIDISNPLEPTLQQEIALGEAQPIAVGTTSGFFHVLDNNQQIHSYYIP